MNVSNTRAVTGLYIASGKNDPLHIGGIVGGVAVRICSLPAYLNGGKTPSARELRGIIEGRSVVAAAPWACFDAVAFGVTSAETAFDTAAEYDGLLYAVAAHRENVIDTLRENGRSHLQPQALAAFDARCAAKSSLYVDIGVTVRRDSSAGNNGTLVDVEEVSDQGATIGHVFAAVNPRRGRIEFKAQGNGGVQCGFSSDFKGAVLMLVAHVRMIGAAVPYFGVYHVDEDGELELCEVDGGVCYVAHRTEEAAQNEAGCAASGNKSKYVAKPIPAGVRVFDALLNCEALSGAHPVADVVRVGACMVIISGEAGKPVERSGLPARAPMAAPQSVTVTITEQAHQDASHTELLEYASRLRYRLTMAYPDARITVQRDDCAAYTVIASTGAVDHADVVGIIDVLNECDDWRSAANVPRHAVAAKAAPGEMIYPATGPCAVGGAA